MIRVIIIEDQSILRESLEFNLAHVKDLTIVGSWNNAEDALLFLRSADTDVALVDNVLPGMDGVTFTAEALKLKPKLKIIMLSMFVKGNTVYQAFDNGAHGFMTKDVKVHDLVEAIHTVLMNKTIVSDKIMHDYMICWKDVMPEKKVQALLSDDQKRILKMAAAGMSNKEISEEMGCSSSVVKHNLSDIMRKLDARDRTHSVIKALKAGIITVECEHSHGRGK